jgi:hypothetical protein
MRPQRYKASEFSATRHSSPQSRKVPHQQRRGHSRGDPNSSQQRQCPETIAQSMPDPHKDINGTPQHGLFFSAGSCNLRFLGNSRRGPRSSLLSATRGRGGRCGGRRSRRLLFCGSGRGMALGRSGRAIMRGRPGSASYRVGVDSTRSNQHRHCSAPAEQTDPAAEDQQAVCAIRCVWS